ncbi:integrase, catalytic region, zinc finger, CCHC-type containing protein [Tanacetum coccineum]
MLTFKTYQQSLADAGSKTRPPMLKRGSYIPWASRFKRFLNRKRENRKWLLKALEDGPYVFRNITPTGSTIPRLQEVEDLQGDDLLYYDAEMELMNMILLSIPNEIYNSVDSCKTAKEMWARVERLMRGTIQNQVDRETRFTNEFDQFVAEPGESLVSVYNRFAQLMNDLERNNMKFPTVSVNTKFLNSLQPEWLKYVTQVRLAKQLTVDSFDDLFDYLSQFEKLVNASRAKKLEKSHDPLALVAHTGSSSRNTSSYYVTHPSSVVDYDEEYEQDDVHNHSEDPLASAMLLLAKAITQNFSNPTNNRLRASSNTRNQAVVQGDRVNIQSRNSGNVGRNNRRAYVQEEVVEGMNATNETANVQRIVRTPTPGNTSTGQCYNCGGKGHYARNCPKPRVRDSKYFMEQMLLAKQDEAGVILTDEQNDFLFADASRMEEIEELSANICLMARIQPADQNSDDEPSYESAFEVECLRMSKTLVILEEVKTILALVAINSNNEDPFGKPLSTLVELNQYYKSNVNIVRPKQPVPTSNSNSFSLVRPQVNKFNLRSNLSTSHSPVRRPIVRNTAKMPYSHAVKGNWGTAVKTLAGSSTQVHGGTEKKPNVKGVGYRWMFDIDYLIDSMNYIPVSLENQTNPHAGTSEVTNSAGTLQTPNANASEEEDEAGELIVMPTIVKHTAAKVKPRKSSTNSKAEEFLTKLPTIKQEKRHSTGISNVTHEILAFRRELDELAQRHSREVPKNKATSTTSVNSGSGPVNTQHADQDDSICQSYNLYASLNRDFLCGSYDDEGMVHDFNNLPTEVVVSPIPTLRIHNIYPQSQILGDPKSSVQTRSRKLSNIIQGHAPLKSWCDEFKDLMQGRFQMSSIDLLTKFDLASVKTVITLMETKMALTKDEEADDVDVHLYRSMIDRKLEIPQSRIYLTLLWHKKATMTVMFNTPFEKLSSGDDEVNSGRLKSIVPSQ